jgi:hypothetical protein
LSIIERRKNKMNYIGMDIHKQFTVAVAKDRDGNKLAEEKFDNGKNEFQKFLQEFKPEETSIVIEVEEEFYSCDCREFCIEAHPEIPARYN